MKTLRQIINDEPSSDSTSDKELKESLVGKGFAIGQNRQHQSIKNQVLGKLSKVQNDCKRAAQEDDDAKRYKLLFEIVYDLASAMKLFAEMSTKTNNIATTAVLDQENLKKELAPLISKLKGRP